MRVFLNLPPAQAKKDGAIEEEEEKCSLSTDQIIDKAIAEGFSKFTYNEKFAVLMGQN